MKLFVLVGLAAFLGVCQAQKANVTSILGKVLENYDKRVRPNWGGPPVDVGITMYFIEIFGMSTKEQTVKSDFYLRQVWTDPRLAFDLPGTNIITLGSDFAKSIWEPDTFFPEGHGKISHDENMLYRINRDGTVLKSIRVFSTSRLNMDLQYFPRDKQIFALSFESYGYTAKDIKYKWHKGKDSVGISPTSGTHEMSVDGFRLSTQDVYLSMGNYSRLGVEVSLTRNSGYYCRHFYLPAIVAFLFAWASFWFNPAQPVVRVLLILSSILTGNYLLAQTLDYIPQVNQSTMLEKYIVFGLIMAALAVGECALVLYLERRGRRSAVYQSDLESSLLDEGNKNPAKNQEVDVDESKKSSESYIIRSTKYIMTIHQHRRSHQKVDIFFRVLYPVIYIIYNIWYWLAFP